jgi:hypothetical protein
MSYQQNLADRKIRILVLNSRRITLAHIAPLVPDVAEALNHSSEGSFIIIEPKDR